MKTASAAEQTFQIGSPAEYRPCMNFIELRGVRVHNLKNIVLRLPLGRLIAITGVSGAGKSSLAFDTLVAEGRRRYIETFAPAARQFLERIERPDADVLDRLPPAVAFRAESVADARRSVGSVTQIDELLQILFARLGSAICPKCQSSVSARSAEQVAGDLAVLPEGTRFVIAFPAEADDTDWQSLGFVRGLSLTKAAGPWQVRSIDLSQSVGTRGNTTTAKTWVVVDRLVAGKVPATRLIEGVEVAFQHGRDRCAVLWEASHALPPQIGLPVDWEGTRWQFSRYSRRLACANCDIEFPPLEPNLFNFDSSLGACSRCHGSGVVESKTTGRRNAATTVCPVCSGSRLAEFGRSVLLGSPQSPRNIATIRELPVAELTALLSQIEQHVTESDRPVVANVFSEMSSRLRLLEELALSHLSLGRSLRTLSRGERQRTRLAGLLATRLDNALYVLDEPSSSLHTTDLPRVLQALRRLQQSGNTVIVVEHHPAMISAADFVVDLGPGAGRQGGEVLFAGSPDDLLNCETSQTATWFKRLATKSSDRPPIGTTHEQRAERPTAAATLCLSGVTLHNLNDRTFEFPLGGICAVTGVSGSGKSSLIAQTLFPALCERFGKTHDISPIGTFRELTGVEHLDDAVFVDASPLRKSARANAATMLHILGDIRSLFAESTEAKVKNLLARHFSFNASDGGRCPRCRGLGCVEIDMQFLANLTVKCPECHGSRFQPDILEAKLRGQSIAEVLQLSADESFAFFRGQTVMQRRLKVLKDVGLGYLPLGQSAATLSRGECQRLKLASHLTSRSKSRTLFLLDEPTTSLHPADVAVLLDCLRRMIDVGHSVIAIEQRQDFLDQADWVLDISA